MLIDITRKLQARSERVKSVCLAENEPWLLCALYSGQVTIYNIETGALVKSFAVAEVPVRCVKFIERKNWFVAGSDDFNLRCFNYNTHEKIAAFEAHPDYIRGLAVHPTQPFVLTGSDDMTIKLWDYEKNWKCIQVYEGHAHYVMNLAFNPKDTNTFASSCLDRTIKVWNLGTPVANFTLEGHDKGANYVEYYYGADKPYMITTGDDRLIKVWDYQSKAVIQTLEGHTSNISFVFYHPNLPLIVSGSEDGTVKLWNAHTYRLEQTLNYGLERAWCAAYMKGNNTVGLGFDEGAIVINLGKEEPSVSMDASGKIVYNRNSEILTTNVKATVDDNIRDGERLVLQIKELGSTEVYAQSLQHSPNGRFVTVCGDGEYIVYTALAWRNRAFGQGLDFVWAHDTNHSAVRESPSKVKVFDKSFKERANLISFAYAADGLFGGHLIAIRSASFLSFHDWETGALVRRIEVVPRCVIWSESGQLVTIATESSFYVLRYSAEAYAEHLAADLVDPEEGCEQAFEIIAEISEKINVGRWAGDCFIYTNAANRLNYLVGTQTITISHFDRNMYLLGYIPRDNRIYLADKDVNVTSYSLSLALIEYQTAILRQDYEAATNILPSVPQDQRNRIGRFLEGQGLKELALEVTIDPNQRFDLAISLNKLDLASSIAETTESDIKWKTLGDRALSSFQFDLAEKCFTQAKDLGSLMLLFNASGNQKGLRRLGEEATRANQRNLAFAAYLQLGDVDHCIDLLVAAKRVPEAAFFARTYAPSKAGQLTKLWKSSLVREGKHKLADSLGDPDEEPNMFPGWKESLEAERKVKGHHVNGDANHLSLSDNLAAVNLDADSPIPSSPSLVA